MRHVRVGLTVHAAHEGAYEALCGATVSDTGSGGLLPITCGVCAEAARGPLYAFCENVGAGSWHIRILSGKGMLLSGGADTPTLCGRRADWDIPTTISAATLKEACPSCKRIYREALALAR